MKIMALSMLLLLIASPAFARRFSKGSQHELCSIRTVFISGNSDAADIMRQRIERSTWMRLVRSQKGADGVIDVSQHTHTKHFPIDTQETSVSIEVWRGKDLDWSDSQTFGEGIFNSGAGSAVKILLDDLNRVAACRSER